MAMMRLERLCCTACNAPLKVDTKLREGNVVSCMYCGASFVIYGNGTHTVKVYRTVSRSVVNNHYPSPHSSSMGGSSAAPHHVEHESRLSLQAPFLVGCLSYPMSDFTNIVALTPQRAHGGACGRGTCRQRRLPRPRPGTRHPRGQHCRRGTRWRQRAPRPRA